MGNRRSSRSRGRRRGSASIPGIREALTNWLIIAEDSEMLAMMHLIKGPDLPALTRATRRDSGARLVDGPIGGAVLLHFQATYECAASTAYYVSDRAGSAVGWEGDVPMHLEWTGHIDWLVRVPWRPDGSGPWGMGTQVPGSPVSQIISPSLGELQAALTEWNRCPKVETISSRPVLLHVLLQKLIRSAESVRKDASAALLGFIASVHHQTPADQEDRLRDLVDCAGRGGLDGLLDGRSIWNENTQLPHWHLAADGDLVQGPRP